MLLSFSIYGQKHHRGLLDIQRDNQANMPWWNGVNDENMLHVNESSLMFRLSFEVRSGGASSGRASLYVHIFKFKLMENKTGFWACPLPEVMQARVWPNKKGAYFILFRLFCFAERKSKVQVRNQILQQNSRGGYNSTPARCSALCNEIFEGPSDRRLQINTIGAERLNVRKMDWSGQNSETQWVGSEGFSKVSGGTGECREAPVMVIAALERVPYVDCGH